MVRHDPDCYLSDEGPLRTERQTGERACTGLSGDVRSMRTGRCVAPREPRRRRARISQRHARRSLHGGTAQCRVVRKPEAGRSQPCLETTAGWRARSPRISLDTTPRVCSRYVLIQWCRTMVFGLLLALFGIGAFCVLIYKAAVYALP